MSLFGNQPEPSGKSHDAHLKFWQSFQGPSNWFTFQCPKWFDVRQEAENIEIRPNGLSGLLVRSASEVSTCETSDPRSDVSWSVLTITARWVECQTFSHCTAFSDIVSCFPIVMASRPEQSLMLESRSEAWSGISRQPASGTFWQRLWSRRQSFQWWFWKIQHGNLQITASIRSGAGLALEPGFVAICESILNSLVIAEQPALPPDAFRREVVALAASRFPLLAIQPSGAFDIRIEDSQVNLKNFYRCYLQQPNRFEQLVLPAISTVVRMHELGPEQLAPQFDEVRQQILPLPVADTDCTDRNLVSMPWVAGLAICFVLDDDDSYRFIHHSMLNRWNISLEELHELALENLSLYNIRHPLAMNVIEDEDEPQLLLPSRPDPYNCSRLLDSSFRAELRRHFGPQLIVGAPNRDFFVALSINQPAVLQHVKRRVDADHRSMHHPLTRRLLLISADGVSEFCEH